MLRGRGVVGAVTGVDMSACVMCLECTAVGLATSAASSDGAAEERRGVRGSLSRRRLTPEYGGIRPRWMSATGLVIPSLLSFWKYFCAWVRIWTTVRVPTRAAMTFHSLPCLRRPLMKTSCSCLDQRPVFSRERDDIIRK